jgi:hypothetical protein
MRLIGSLSGFFFEYWPQIMSFVPTGLEAYARVLHPADEPGNGSCRLVRWREVAEWSGLPLRDDAQVQFDTVQFGDVIGAA